MKKASLRTLWLTLSLPPVLFLLAIIGASASTVLLMVIILLILPNGLLGKKE